MRSIGRLRFAINPRRTSSDGGLRSSAAAEGGFVQCMVSDVDSLGGPGAQRWIDAAAVVRRDPNRAGPLIRGRPEASLEGVEEKRMADTILEALQREHRDLDRRIRELEKRLHLTSDEQVELPRLKKLRLAAKDRMLSLGDPVR